MVVLILAKVQDAHEDKRYLTAKLPEVNFVAARDESEVGDSIEKAEVIACACVRSDN